MSRDWLFHHMISVPVIREPEPQPVLQPDQLTGASPVTVNVAVVVAGKSQERSDRVMETIDRCVAEQIEAAVAKAIADECARIRGWLGQRAADARRDAKTSLSVGFKLGRAEAFKEAADHLKPPKVKAHLARKRAARAGAK